MERNQQGKFIKGYKMTALIKQKIRIALRKRPKKSKPLQVCASCSKEYFAAANRIKRGQGKYCSYSCKSKFISKKTREKISTRMKEITKNRTDFSHLPRGEKHHFWKGGITPINKAIRSSLEYKLWKRAVFKRDNWICIWCCKRSAKGIKVTLNADHIKPFAHYPELRFAIDNGRTLCVPCHKTTDTYKGKSNGKIPR